MMACGCWGDWFWVEVGDCLACPSLLSAPGALTLALSRRAGEGKWLVADRFLATQTRFIWAPALFSCRRMNCTSASSLGFDSVNQSV